MDAPHNAWGEIISRRLTGSVRQSVPQHAADQQGGKGAAEHQCRSRTTGMYHTELQVARFTRAQLHLQHGEDTDVESFLQQKNATRYQVRKAT
jgi:hypothetical protein